MKVRANHRIAPDYGRLAINCAAGYATAEPGQFVMLGLGNGVDPLLRRPFSIHRIVSEKGRVAGLEILYKVVGKATRMIAGLTAGDRVSLLGPLGRGFVVRPDFRRIYIAAGGIGVAPMLFLVCRLKSRGRDLSPCRFFVGGRSKQDLMCVDDLQDQGIDLHISTDDGSAGDACFLTQPLARAVAEQKPDVIYACGPMDMLRCVADVAARQRVACQVSIESAMACGMGACLGCAVAAKNNGPGYRHVCLDGPVFDAAQLVWAAGT